MKSDSTPGSFEIEDEQKSDARLLDAQGEQCVEQVKTNPKEVTGKCIEFVRDLADKTKLTTAPVKKKKRSLASEWASEPLWDPGPDKK